MRLNRNALRLMLPFCSTDPNRSYYGVRLTATHEGIILAATDGHLGFVHFEPDDPNSTVEPPNLPEPGVIFTCVIPVPTIKAIPKAGAGAARRHPHLRLTGPDSSGAMAILDPATDYTLGFNPSTQTFPDLATVYPVPPFTRGPYIDHPAAHFDPELLARFETWGKATDSGGAYIWPRDYNEPALVTFRANPNAWGVVMPRAGEKSPPSDKPAFWGTFTRSFNKV